MRYQASFVAVAAALVLLPQPQDPVVPPEALEAAQRLAQPVAEHELLRRLEGAWEIELLVTTPGERRTERGSVVGRAILGGRFVVLNYKLVLRGQLLEGVQILGFDTLAGRVHVVVAGRPQHLVGRVSPAAPRPTGARARAAPRSSCAIRARSATGRPFRIALTLPRARTRNKVLVSLHDTLDGKEVSSIQTHEWTRK